MLPEPLESLTIPRLRHLAADLGLLLPTKARKAEVIEALRGWANQRTNRTIVHPMEGLLGEEGSAARYLHAPPDIGVESVTLARMGQPLPDRYDVNEIILGIQQAGVAWIGWELTALHPGTRVLLVLPGNPPLVAARLPLPSQVGSWYLNFDPALPAHRLMALIVAQEGAEEKILACSQPGFAPIQPRWSSWPQWLEGQPPRQPLAQIGGGS
ncbi:MAG: hypothetical protein COX57_01155 [Alphaproteobacteria bacterium CG_4_10_14_0_2_um_filter_63_37]|nr:MAG: hypothetical protein AUJ55_00220 [Proteobacteria bacterium CG1_02_64_396]PJA25855.1 MAG: hypothetical protein COX57_01155 [Alphaproteobacteria bacterium CG_4_10_14_0_2_um_filter_63_37]